MTGGGDLDEVRHDQLDELGAAEGEADAPVEYDVAVNENDPDVTAGASDIGGLAGGIDAGDGTRGG